MVHLVATLGPKKPICEGLLVRPAADEVELVLDVVSDSAGSDSGQEVESTQNAFVAFVPLLRKDGMRILPVVHDSAPAHIRNPVHHVARVHSLSAANSLGHVQELAVGLVVAYVAPINLVECLFPKILNHRLILFIQACFTMPESAPQLLVFNPASQNLNSFFDNVKDNLYQVLLFQKSNEIGRITG